LKKFQKIYQKPSTKGRDETAQEFVEDWKRAEAGESTEEPTERLYFQDLATLLQTFTPQKLELLKQLYHAGTSSVRALARLLQRDYKNVHQDVQVLERVGRVVRTADRRVSAPWEKVVAEINLAA
jgi:predicted transcriptional regulator